MRRTDEDSPFTAHSGCPPLRSIGLHLILGGILILLLVTPSLVAHAEKGILVLHVRDAKDQPIAAVQIATEGDGATGPPTDRAGKTRIQLAPQTQPGHRVTLQIVASPQKRDLVFLSPWDRTAQVPPFENESNNYVPTVLADRANRDLLTSDLALRAITSNINRANAPQVPSSTASSAETEEERRQRALTEVARSYGFSATEVDAAIREWGKKVRDPYDAGLAALYERDYPTAAKQLSDSFEIRKKEEARTQAQAARATEAAADAAFFLGQSLYAQGQYGEAVASYRETAQRRPDDPRTLNILAMSLYQAGDYRAAEPLFRKALAIHEKAVGANHPDIASILNNLGELQRVKGDLTGAEPLYRQALAIDEKTLGPNHLAVARDSTISLSCCRPRAILWARSHSSVGRWRPGRKRWGQTMPSSRRVSTISLSCCRPRAILWARSRSSAGR